MLLPATLVLGEPGSDFWDSTFGGGTLPSSDAGQIAASAPPPAQVLATILSENFDSWADGTSPTASPYNGWSNYYIGGAGGSDGDWEHGVPSGAGAPAAQSGTKVWKTGIYANYPAAGPKDYALEAPSLDFSTYAGVQLTYYQWYQFETSITEWDCGRIEVSDNGAPFVPITPTGGYPGTCNANAASALYLQPTFTLYAAAWTQKTFSLAAYDGKPNIKIRFHMAIDNNAADVGWAVDTFLVTGNVVTPPLTPTLKKPFDSARGGNASLNPLQPKFNFTTTDPNGDAITYQIQIDNDVNFSSAITDVSSFGGAGFLDETNGADTDPFASGDTISYTPPSNLPAGTLWWRVRGQDRLAATPGWSAYSTPRSVTLVDGDDPVDFFQTTTSQFEQDARVGTHANAAGDGEARFPSAITPLNPSFETAVSGSSVGARSSTTRARWPESDTCSFNIQAPQGSTLSVGQFFRIYQNVNLSGVGSLGFDLKARTTSATVLLQYRLVIDGAVVWSQNQIGNENAIYYNLNVGIGYSDYHDVGFEVYVTAGAGNIFVRDIWIDDFTGPGFTNPSFECSSTWWSTSTSGPWVTSMTTSAIPAWPSVGTRSYQTIPAVSASAGWVAGLTQSIDLTTVTTIGFDLRIDEFDAVTSYWEFQVVIAGRDLVYTRALNPMQEVVILNVATSAFSYAGVQTVEWRIVHLTGYAGAPESRIFIDDVTPAASFTNPGFESTIGSEWAFGWSTGTFGGDRVTDSKAGWPSIGTYSMRISAPPGSSALVGWYGEAFQFMDLTGVSAITFDLWARATTAGAYYAYRVYIDDTTLVFDQAQVGSENTVFSNRATNVLSYTGMHKVSFRLECTVAAGTATTGHRRMYIDNIRPAGVATNPSFESALSGEWQFRTSGPDPWRFDYTHETAYTGARSTAYASQGTNSILVTSPAAAVSIGQYGSVSAEVDLSGVGKVLFDRRSQTTLTTSVFRYRVLIGSTVVFDQPQNASETANFVDQATIPLAFTGLRKLTFQLYRSVAGATTIAVNMYIDNIRFVYNGSMTTPGIDYADGPADRTSWDTVIWSKVVVSGTITVAMQRWTGSAWVFTGLQGSNSVSLLDISPLGTQSRIRAIVNFTSTSGIGPRLLDLTIAWKIQAPRIEGLDIQVGGILQTDGAIIGAGGVVDFLVNASDAQGTADFDYVELRLQGTSGGVRVKWYEGNDSFVAISNAGPCYTLLSTSAFSNTTSATRWELRFRFLFGWSCAALDANVDPAVQAKDDSSYFKTKTFSARTYHIENDMVFTGALTVTGAINGGLTSGVTWVQGGEGITWAGVKVVFEGTTTTYPPDSDFDVRVADSDGGTTWTQTTSSGSNINIISAADAVNRATDAHTVSIINVPGGGPHQSLTFSVKIDNDIPAKPTALASNITEPTGWTRYNAFTVDWTNPADFSGFVGQGAGYYYKIGGIPANPTDGTLTTAKPITGLTVLSPGNFTIYVWLKDQADWINHVNRAETYLRWDPNAPPGPTIYGPIDDQRGGNFTNGLRPEFVVSSTDGEGNPIRYRTQLDDNSDFSSLVFDATSSASNAGCGSFKDFCDITTPAALDPFPSGDRVRHANMTSLSDLGTYYWRSAAANIHSGGMWSGFTGARAFTVDQSKTEYTWFQTTQAQFDKSTFSGTMSTNYGGGAIETGPTGVFLNDTFNTFGAPDSAKWTIVAQAGIQVNSLCGFRSASNSLNIWSGVNNIETKPILLAGASSATVTYWWVKGVQAASPCEGPDTSTEDLWVEYLRPDGSTWVVIQNVDGAIPGSTIWAKTTFSVPGSDLWNGFKVRFRQEGGSGAANDNYGIDDFNVEVPASASQALSASISYDLGPPGRSSWDAVVWNRDLAAPGSVTVSIQKCNAGCASAIWVTAPDTTGQIDISFLGNMSGTSHPFVRLVANLTYSGGSPRLLDWEVSWFVGPKPRNDGMRIYLGADAVAHYRVEEASGTLTDYSGNGNTGSVVGAVRTSDTPPFQFPSTKSLTFDGIDDIVTASDSASLVFSTQLTVSTWVKLDAGCISTSICGMVSKDSEFVLRRDASGEGQRFSFFVHDGVDFEPRVSTGTTPVTGVWYHVAGTFDGKNVRIYLNGVLEGTVANTAVIPNTVNQLVVGRGHVAGTFLPGKLDDVRVFDRVLSLSEIKTLAGAAITDNSPIFAGLAAEFVLNVSDPQGAANLATLDLRLDGTSSYVARWTENGGLGVFSELAGGAQFDLSTAGSIALLKGVRWTVIFDIRMLWTLTWADTMVDPVAVATDDNANVDIDTYTARTYSVDDDLVLTGALTVYRSSTSCGAGTLIASGSWVAASQSIHWCGSRATYQADTTVTPAQADFNLRVDDDDTDGGNNFWDQTYGPDLSITSVSDALYDASDIHSVSVVNTAGGGPHTPVNFETKVDPNPPGAPVTPTANGANPSPWSDVDSFSIDWTHPAQETSTESGVKGVWYKLNSAPAFAGDGLFTTSKPFIFSPGVDGVHTLYLYLEDNVDNRNHLNVATVTLRLDRIAPTAPAPTIPIPFQRGGTFTNPLRPTFDFLSTDSLGNDVRYQVQVDDDFAFGSPVADVTSGSGNWGCGAGKRFCNLITPADDDPFRSGEKVRFSLLADLVNGTTYWWRVRAANIHGAVYWSAYTSPMSFTIDSSKPDHSWFATTKDQFAQATHNSTFAKNLSGGNAELSSSVRNIFSEHFPATTLESAKWESATAIADAGCGAPTNTLPALALHVDGGATPENAITRTMDLSQANQASLQIQYRVGDNIDADGAGPGLVCELPEADDELIVEYFNSASTWVCLAEFDTSTGTSNIAGCPVFIGSATSTWNTRAIPLPAAARHSAVKFRFKLDVSEAADDWAIDEIKVVYHVDPLNDGFGTTTLESIKWTPSSTAIIDGGCNVPPGSAPGLSLHIDGGATPEEAITTPMDLSKAPAASLSFQYKIGDGADADGAGPGLTCDIPEANDELIVEYLNSGSTWVCLAEVDTGAGTNNIAGCSTFIGSATSVYSLRSIPLPAAARHAAVQFKFKLDVSEAADDWAVDEVRLDFHTEPLLDGFATTTLENSRWEPSTAIVDGGCNVPPGTAPGLSLHIDGGATPEVATTVAMDLSRADTASLSFQYKIGDGADADGAGPGLVCDIPEANDELIVEYLNSGSTWVCLAELDTGAGTNNIGGCTTFIGSATSTYNSRLIPLPQAARHSLAKFRFKLDVSEAADDWAIDEVKVEVHADPFNEMNPTTTLESIKWESSTAIADGGCGVPTATVPGLSLHIDGGATPEQSVTIPMDLSQAAAAFISFQYKIGDNVDADGAGAGLTCDIPEANDELILDYWDGSSWQCLVEFDTGAGTNNIAGCTTFVGSVTSTYASRFIELPTGARHSTAKFRFRLDVSEAADDWAVDELRISIQAYRSQPQVVSPSIAYNDGPFGRFSWDKVTWTKNVTLGGSVTVAAQKCSNPTCTSPVWVTAPNTNGTLDLTAVGNSSGTYLRIIGNLTGYGHQIPRLLDWELHWKIASVTHEAMYLHVDGKLVPDDGASYSGKVVQYSVVVKEASLAVNLKKVDLRLNGLGIVARWWESNNTFQEVAGGSQFDIDPSSRADTVDALRKNVTFAIIWRFDKPFSDTVVYTPELFSENDFQRNRTDTFGARSYRVENDLVTGGPGVHLRLNEAAGSTASDATGNNPAAAIVGATWSTGDRKEGASALSFDGSGDYVEIADSASTSPTNELTAALWVKLQANAVDNSYTMVRKGGSFLFELGDTGINQLAGKVSSGGSNNPGVFSPTQLKLNTWYHVAFTFDGAALRLYVNGTLDAETARSVVIDDSTNALFLGMYSTENFPAGKMDDFRFYNRALSLTEIASLMGEAPLADYRLDERSGLTVKDSAGQSPDGTLVNGPTWKSGTDAKSVSALSFNSTLTQYVEVPHSSWLSAAGGGLTLEAWIKPGVQPPGGCSFDRIVMSKGDVYELAVNNNGTISYAIRNTVPGWAWVHTGKPVTLNAWSHVAVTYDGAMIRTYINGVTVHERSGAGPMVDPSTFPFRIGARADCGVDPFQGSIDEVRIFGHAIPSSEILRHARLSNTLGLPAVEYRLDEASGVVARDSQGAGTDGALSNGPQWIPGVSGSALNFDGNDDAVIMNPFSNFPSREVSVSLWMKSTDITKEGNGFSYATTAFNNEFRLDDHRNFRVFIGGTASAYTGVSVNDGYWHHVAVTWRSSDGQLRLYRDGSLLYGTTLRLGYVIPATGAVVLGQDQDTVGGGFQVAQAFLGQLDEVRIFGHALDPVEVRRLTSLTSLSGGALRPHSAYSGNVNCGAAATPGSWVRGGEALTWTGIGAYYEGSGTQTYDTVYDYNLTDDVGTRTLQTTGAALNLQATVKSLTDTDYVNTFSFDGVPTGGGPHGSMTCSLRVDADLSQVGNSAMTLAPTTDPGANVNVNFYDNQSGLARVEYRFENQSTGLVGPWYDLWTGLLGSSSKSDDFNLWTNAPDGAHKVRFRVTDIVGNVREDTSLTYNVVVEPHSLRLYGSTGSEGVNFISMNVSAKTLWGSLTAIQFGRDITNRTGRVASEVCRRDIGTDTLVCVTTSNGVSYSGADFVLVPGEGLVVKMKRQSGTWPAVYPIAGRTLVNPPETSVRITATGSLTLISLPKTTGTYRAHDQNAAGANSLVKELESDAAGQGIPVNVTEVSFWDSAQGRWRTCTWVDILGIWDCPSETDPAVPFTIDAGKAYYVNVKRLSGVASTFSFRAGPGWSNMAPAAPPSSRYEHGMAYASSTDRTILFGGCTGGYGCGAFSDETWSYNANTNVWANLAPAGSKPSQRMAFAMAYDAPSDRVVLYGGCIAGGGPTCSYTTSDTWAYDPGANLWTNLTSTVSCVAGCPQKLGWNTMAYDSQSDRVVMFGGCSKGIDFCNPGIGGKVTSFTYAYDFNTNTWTNMSGGTAPTARRNAGMAYDSQSDRIVLFGGDDYTNGFDDTWTYDFNTNSWVQKIIPVGARPPSLPWGYAKMAYNTLTDRVFVSYGAGTWTYDLENNRWTDLALTAKPANRWGHSLVYDPDSKAIVLFGGYSFNQETWLFV